MTTKEYTKKKEELLEHTLSRTCEHKGCKRVVCNHAYNEASKAIDSLFLDVIGEDEEQCNCEDDPMFGYHTKYCENNGTFYGFLRNQLRNSLRKIIGGK